MFMVTNGYDGQNKTLMQTISNVISTLKMKYPTGYILVIGYYIFIFPTYQMNELISGLPD